MAVNPAFIILRFGGDWRKMTVSAVKFHATALLEIEPGMTMIERFWQFAVGLSVSLGIPAGPSAALDAATDPAMKVSNPAASLISAPSRHLHESELGGGKGTQDLVAVFQLPASIDDRLCPKQVTEGWNYVVRLYRPQPAVLEKTWTLPDAVPVQ